MGGLFLDMSVHDLDLPRFLVGEVEQVQKSPLGGDSGWKLRERTIRVLCQIRRAPNIKSNYERGTIYHVRPEKLVTQRNYPWP